MSLIRHKIDELDLRDRWIRVTNGCDLMGYI